MKRPLTFAVTNHGVCPWPLGMLAEVLAYHFRRTAGANYPTPMLAEWRQRVNRMAVDVAGFDRLARRLAARVRQQPGWGRQRARLIRPAVARLLKFTRALARADLRRLDDRQLAQRYAAYRQHFLRFYGPAYFPNALEGLSAVFSRDLERYLRRHLRDPAAVGEYLSVLTTPTKLSTRQREETELFEIAVAVVRRKLPRLWQGSPRAVLERLRRRAPGLYRRLVGHHRRYGWLSFDYDGPAERLTSVVRRLQVAVVLGPGISERQAAFRRNRIMLRRRQQQYARQVGLNRDRRYGALFTLAHELMYLKEYRKDAVTYSYYRMDAVIREIGRRIALSPLQVKHLLPWEMASALLERRYRRQDLERRMRYTVLLYRGDGVQVFTGAKARAAVRRYVAPTAVPRRAVELRGQCAYPGMVTGVVRLVFTVADLPKVRTGDILVSPATNPNLLPAMRRAAAFVTDKGGITAHAAVVARELRTPCVVGTTIATRVLRDGDRVAVDASRGMVTKLSRRPHAGSGPRSSM